MNQSETEIARLRAALEIYADADNWFDVEPFRGPEVPAWRGPNEDHPEEIARAALAIEPPAATEPEDCKQCGHLMRWHDPSDGVDDTHACVQCALIAANRRYRPDSLTNDAAPPPAVLEAADALAEAVRGSDLSEQPTNCIPMAAAAYFAAKAQAGKESV